MKSTMLALSILLAASFSAYATDQLIPAGSLLQCTVSEPKLSSRTTAIGDPVLCRISHAERYGRSVLPYDSYLVGRFDDYRDPGHFVGKGWMQLSFDRMVIQPNTVVPVEARVVDVPGYVIDRQGRIMGKGHATRDTVEWMIPVLWPIDLLTLPRRGPRPTLKEETRLTLKVMDDLRVPQGDQPDRDPYGLYRRPSASADPAPSPAEEQKPPAYEPTAAAPPQPSYAPQPEYAQQQQPQYAQPVYAPPPVYVAMPMVVMPQPVYVTPPPMYLYSPPRMVAPPLYGPSRTALVMRGGYAYRVLVP
jgi:hypothetical protein